VLFGGSFIIPVGSFLIGATFMLRDFVQMKHGRKAAYRTIFGALVLSGILSAILGDTMYVATASMLAFLASEAIDTEIFSRAKFSIAGRVLASGIAGGTIDSAIFVVVGLSPLTSGVLLWGQVPFAIIGQMVTKVVVQILVVMILRRFSWQNAKGAGTEINNDEL
jgi:uncharacterized PurR-regulated membrane protein YhhQ (DUF165 family)